MKTLKTKIIAGMAAAAAVAAIAAPAAAQPYRYDARWHPDSRAATAERRIESGLRNGEISRREARRLYAQVDDFARAEANYRRGGLSRWERADLDRRYQAFIRNFRHVAYDEYGRGYGHRR